MTELTEDKEMYYFSCGCRFISIFVYYISYVSVGLLHSVG